MSAVRLRPVTKKHVLSNCSNPAALRRYTIRYNDILSLLVRWLTSIKSANQLLYADLSDANILPICDLFYSITVVPIQPLPMLRLFIFLNSLFVMKLIQFHPMTINQINIRTLHHAVPRQRGIVKQYLTSLKFQLWDLFQTALTLLKLYILMRCPLR